MNIRSLRDIWHSPLGILVVGILLGLAVKFSSMMYEVDFTLGTIMALLTTSLLLLVRITGAIRTEPESEARQKVYKDQRKALRHAERLQKKTDRVWAMWGAMSYDTSLRDYYGRTLGAENRVETLRIIDLDLPLEDIRDHLREHWPLIQGEKRGCAYEVYFIRRLDFEVLLMDDERAAVFLSAGDAPQFYVISGGKRLASCVKGIFSYLLKQGSTTATSLPLSKLPREFDEVQVMAFLEAERSRDEAQD